LNEQSRNISREDGSAGVPQNGDRLMAKLTEGAVAALKVPEGKRDVIVFDDALPGFGVRKFASGKASYFVKYRLGAQQRKITLGHALPGILADIRRQAAKVLAEVKLGQDVATRKKEAAAKKSATIGGLIEGYIAERQLRLKPRTMEGIVLHLRGHWAWLHGRAVEKLSRQDIIAGMDRIADDHGRTASDRAKTSLCGFFAWCLDRGYCDANPVLGIKRRGANPSRSRVLSFVELADVWNTCSAGDYGKIVKLLILTGQRRNEIANLQWHEIDFVRAEITFPPERTKNGLQHVLPMSPQILAILEQTDAIASRDFVFGHGLNAGFQAWSRSKRILDGKINAARSACGEEPISEWLLHDLRRSFVTHLVEQKLAPPHIVEACVNHQSGHRGGVAGVYNRALYAEEKRAAFEAWGAFITRHVQASG
jgi:integrase